MKYQIFHETNFGFFTPRHLLDANGFITVHDSPRYASATDKQLDQWCESRLSTVRAAAEVEQRKRAMREA